MTDRLRPSKPESWSAVIVLPLYTSAFFICLVFFLQSPGIGQPAVLYYSVWSQEPAVALTVPAEDIPTSARSTAPKAGDTPPLARESVHHPRLDWSALSGIAPLSPVHHPRHRRGLLDAVSTPLLS